MVLCKYIVKEIINLSEVVSSVLISIGICIICSFTDHTSIKYTYESVIKLFQNKMFIIFLSVLIPIIFIMLIIISSPQKVISRNRNILFLCYGISSGSIGGCQFLIKVFVLLMKKGFNDYKVFKYYYTYIIIFFTLFIMLVQIYILNLGLKHFTSKRLLPLYQGSFIIIGSLCGIIFFKEYDKMNVLQWIFYSLGLLFIISGLVNLIFLSKNEKNEIKIIIKR